MLVIRSRRGLLILGIRVVESYRTSRGTLMALLVFITIDVNVTLLVAIIRTGEASEHEVMK